MFVKTLALAGAFALFATAVFADDPMANTYANTITTKNTANGQSATLLFNADNTYTGMTTGPDGAVVTADSGFDTHTFAGVSIDDLVTASGGLYTPPAKFRRRT